MKRNKAVLWGVLMGLCGLMAVTALVLEEMGRMPSERLGGVLMGAGAGIGCFCLSQFLMELHYRRNEKARRMAEIDEKDERSRAIRGEAGYRALLAGTPIFITEWVILLVLDVSIWVFLLVCAAYVTQFGVYLYHLLRLHSRM